MECELKKKGESIFYEMLPLYRKSIAFWKSPRALPIWPSGNSTGLLISLSPNRKETSSEACQGRARFQQHGDASCHQGFFPPTGQGAAGNSRHSERNIGLFPSWSG